nr:hypothetical protein [Tanacetum cinerariifolium]
MASFGYRLNPLYTIKECLSCGALYTTDYCCSNESLVDNIICDLNKAPDSPHLHTFSSNQRHCFQCKDVLGDGEFCQRCTSMRCGSGLSKGLCLIYGNNQNSLNDTPSISENSSQSPPQINHHCCYGCGDPLEDIFCHQCTCESCGKGAHYGYNCPPKVPIIPNPGPYETYQCQPMNEDCYPEQNYCYNSNSIGFDQFPPQQLPVIDQTPLEESMKNLRITFQALSENIQQKREEEEKQIAEEQAAEARCWKIPICYDDDDDYTIAITPKEPDNSLSMGDEHLDTISATESDEIIKSSVENFVPNPNESEGEHECDVPACEDFTNFSNLLFDVDDDSPLIDSLLDEFVGELTLLKSIPPGINETDCNLKEETRLIKKLLYDNSSPRHQKNLFLKILMLHLNLSLHFLSLLRTEKSPNLLSHQGHEASQPSTECPMMIYGRNTPILDVPFLHFYPL